MTTETKPNCIGIILDGNRRWAKNNNLPSLEGHRQGVERMRDVSRWVRDRDIKHLAVYAFSTENWSRGQEEVNYLLKLLRTAIDTFVSELAKEDIRIKFVGERNRFDEDTREAMSNVEEKSSENEKLTLWVCLSYGGRAEIVKAVNSLSKGADVTEEVLSQNLWTQGMPDPDIIIRTGGEKRLSGFLTWQSVYSELFFIDEYWPDFSEKILDRVLSEFSERTRRMGR